jgi:hypothetical protein
MTSSGDALHRRRVQAEAAASPMSASPEIFSITRRYFVETAAWSAFWSVSGMGGRVSGMGAAGRGCCGRRNMV